MISADLEHQVIVVAPRDPSSLSINQSICQLHAGEPWIGEQGELEGSRTERSHSKLFGLCNVNFPEAATHFQVVKKMLEYFVHPTSNAK